MSSSLRVSFLHFNDVHGHIDALPRLMAAVERQRQICRAERRHCYLVNTGDNFSGGPVSDLNDGRPTIALLNRMRVSALAVGNHDFDHGPAATAARRSESRFVWLCANVRKLSPPATPIPRFHGYRVWRTPDGHRIAVLALLSARPATNDANIVGLEFTDPVARARALVPRLRRRADLVLAITHLGLDEDRRLAAAVPDLDLIIGGHSHTPLFQPVRVGGVPIVQAGAHGSFLGRVDVTRDNPRRGPRVWSELFRTAAEPAEDPGARAVVDRWNARMEPVLGEVIGSAVRPLSRERRYDRDVALGNLITDAMRATLDGDVALCNNGSIRTSLPAGPLTLRSVYEVLPFGDYWVKLAVTGAQLAEIIRYSYVRDGRNRIDLQASGLTYTIRRGAGGAFAGADLRIGGRPLEPDATYGVVVSDYVARGGSGYPFPDLQAPRLAVSSRTDARDLAAYIRRLEQVDYPATERRIRLASTPTGAAN